MPPSIDWPAIADGQLHPAKWMEILAVAGFDTSRESSVLALCQVLRHETWQRGHTVYTEGTEGSDIYIVVSGSVQETNKAASSEPRLYGPGSFFGESALLNSDPVRHSAMTTCEATHLARMDAAALVKHKIDLSLFSTAQRGSHRIKDKAQLQNVELMAAKAGVGEECMHVVRVGVKEPGNRTPDDLDAMMALPELAGFFATKRFFKSDNRGQKLAVCSVMQSGAFGKGQLVCGEGEQGNSMYILIWGRLCVSVLDKETGEKQHIRHLEAGEHFGELALINGDGTRTSTVMAETFSLTLQLNRNDYHRSFRQAGEQYVIEKIEALQTSPLFHRISLKQLIRVAHASELTMLKKGQKLFNGEAQNGSIFLVVRGPPPHHREGIVAASTTIQDSSGSVMHVKLGLHGLGSILGVEAYTSQKEAGRVAFAYIAQSDVRVLSCSFAALARCCDSAFMDALREFREGFLSQSQVEQLVQVQTKWMQTRSREFLLATGLKPRPPESLLMRGSLEDGSKRTPALIRDRKRPENSANQPLGSPLPRVVSARRAPCDVSLTILAKDGAQTERCSKQAAKILSEIDRLEAESKLISSFSAKIKMECNEMIEQRESSNGRFSPTPPAVAKMPEEANRRLLQLRLWDPLVRKQLTHGPRQPLLSTASASTKQVVVNKSMQQVDLSNRLPKQFGTFTERVYGVTVLVANITCRHASETLGLSWLHFLHDNLFEMFQEQANMRGLMRCKDSRNSRFTLIGGMPHTKSFTSSGAPKAASLVADVARRMIEDVQTSNSHHKQHQSHHKAQLENETSQQDRTFEVSIRIGISSGNVAIGVFGRRQPVYFGVCGAETDTAQSLALMPVDEDESAVMISDSTNLLIKDTYFTAPQTVKVQTRVHEHWKEEIVHGYALAGKRNSELPHRPKSTQRFSTSSVGKSKGTSRPSLANRGFRDALKATPTCPHKFLRKVAQPHYRRKR